MTPSYEVTAKPWEGGWELHIHDVGVTQIEGGWDPLAAERMVRDYLRGLGGMQPAGFGIRFRFREDAA